MKNLGYNKSKKRGFVMSKELEKVVYGLQETTTKINTNLIHLQKGFDRLTETMELLVKHESEIDHLQEDLKSIKDCTSKTLLLEQKVVTLEKKLEKTNGNLNKIGFVLFGAVISIVVKFIFLHKVVLPAAGS